MDHTHDRYYTPDEEYRIARAVWQAERDGRHAAHHLAAALVGDPLHADRLNLLDEIIAGTDDPLSIAPMGKDGTYLGTVAVRAYVLAELGQIPEAVDLIGQVHHANPAAPFLEWAIGWLFADPAAAARIEPPALYRFFGPLLSKYPGNVVEVPAARAELDAALRFHAVAVPAGHPDVMLAYTRIALLRKLGRLDEADAAARAAYDREPNYQFATALALIAQSRGEFDSWKVWMNKALEHDPADTAVRRDLGDGLLDRGEFADAARHYADALRIDPADGWSEASLYFANHKLGIAGDWLARLQAFAAAHPDSDRARSLLGDGVPYLTRLPTPCEAIVNMLPQLIANARADKANVPTGELKITVSALEAPSARLAVRLQLEALGGDGTLSVAVSKVQSPDPRRPRGEVAHRVWSYLEERKLLGWRLSTDPVPAVPEPPPAVAAAVGRIAGMAFDRPAWFTAAADVKADEYEPAQVLGVMAFPPAMPVGWYAPDWVLRCQVVAALALAHTPAGRAVLFDLLRGPYDWAVTAAAVALAAAAAKEPAIAGPALAAFLDLLESLPRPGYVCYEHPVVCLIQQLPGVPADVAAHFAMYLAEMERANEEESTVGGRP